MSSASVSVPEKILLAEDDPAMREMIAFSLFKAGYQVESCDNGLDLYGRLEKADADGVAIGLIISDVRMPAMTGLEVLEVSSVCADRPPFICMTAFGDDETHAQALKFGAAAILDKPFALEQLLAKVKDLLPVAYSPSGTSYPQGVFS